MWNLLMKSGLEFNVDGIYFTGCRFYLMGYCDLEDSKSGLRQSCLFSCELIMKAIIIEQTIVFAMFNLIIELEIIIVGFIILGTIN
jgi:hypothetical protein